MDNDSTIIHNTPFWKHLLSYLQPIQLEYRSSDFHEELYVYLSKGDFQLCTSEALYSYGRRYYNFSKLFKKLDLPQDSKVLLLGLGLGSIPLILEKNHHRNYCYTALEIDGEIIDLAHKYVTHALSSHIDYVEADAYPFLLTCEDTFDIIIMDIFKENNVPRQFIETEIVHSFNRLLKPNGLFLQNFMNINTDDQSIISAFENQASTIFTNYTFIPIWKSLMFVSNKQYLK